MVRRAPDVIIGSWCGRKFRPERVVARPGWGEIPAVAGGHVYEVKSALILQPGPAALTDGVEALAGDYRGVEGVAARGEIPRIGGGGSRLACDRAPGHVLYAIQHTSVRSV